MDSVNKRQGVSNFLLKIRPAMEADGGGIADFQISNEDVVYLVLKGTCLFCPSKLLTLNIGIKKPMLQELPWVKDVNLLTK